MRTENMLSGRRNPLTGKHLLQLAGRGVGKSVRKGLRRNPLAGKHLLQLVPGRGYEVWYPRQSQSPYGEASLATLRPPRIPQSLGVVAIPLRGSISCNASGRLWPRLGKRGLSQSPYGEASLATDEEVLG